MTQSVKELIESSYHDGFRDCSEIILHALIGYKEITKQDQISIQYLTDLVNGIKVKNGGT